MPANVQTIGHKGSYAYISRKSLKRGDIVCFENDSEDSKVVDHVGIYLGKNYFIHVSPSAATTTRPSAGGAASSSNIVL